mgnify:CR=1 FL=1
MKKYIIGIDSGTTSIKAVVMDIRGNVIHKKDFKLTQCDVHNRIFSKKKDASPNGKRPFFAAFQKFVFGAQDWTRTSMPLGAAT